MREAGLEPAWSYPLDPKSSASANSATLAQIVLERETGLEPATSTLARLRSTTELLPRIDKISLGRTGLEPVTA